ncbi:glutathione S-transferase family protein [Paraburkholderia sp.]|jgi:glutathione S-transferase|uniref:glutathione S-transferase family protein n=1 Tax=Paraburkholderia sp. TaxID=1926495 RepID=UPI0026201B48|nr:glutathione S-transferase family protein [Paraburkholderia sp.]
MPLTIFGTSRSRALRVLWMASELGLAFKHDPLDWRDCRQSAQYRLINPAGTIPSISDDGLVLAESLAINLYLAQRAGMLWPEGIKDQALVSQWTLWVATVIESAYTQWASHTYWLPEAARDASLAASSAAEMQAPLDRLELALVGSEWLVGAAFSVADLNVASVISMVRRFEREKRPHLMNWLDRCCARPAFQQAVKLP